MLKVLFYKTAFNTISVRSTKSAYCTISKGFMNHKGRRMTGCNKFIPLSVKLKLYPGPHLWLGLNKKDNSLICFWTSMKCWTTNNLIMKCEVQKLLVEPEQLSQSLLTEIQHAHRDLCSLTVVKRLMSIFSSLALEV